MESTNTRTSLHLVPAEADARAAARWGRAIDGCKLLGWMLAGGTVAEIVLAIVQMVAP